VREKTLPSPYFRRAERMPKKNARTSKRKYVEISVGSARHLPAMDPVSVEELR